MKNFFLSAFFFFYVDAEIREYRYDKDFSSLLLIAESAFDALRDPEHQRAQDILCEYFLYGTTIFVLEDGDNVSGFISVLEQNPFLPEEHKEESVGIICLLALVPEYRNKGLGKRLINRALDWFAEHNVYRISLYVHKDNIKAKRFYKRIGFTHLIDKNDPLVQGFREDPCSLTDDIFVINL